MRRVWYLQVVLARQFGDETSRWNRVCNILVGGSSKPWRVGTSSNSGEVALALTGRTEP